MIKNTNIKSSVGFTIVELLVVVVIIGVLASIALISYAGVRGKATEISVQADSTNAAKQLAMFKVDNGSYPQTIDCSQPNSSTNLCIRASGGNNMIYATDETATPQVISLYFYGGGSYYQINETLTTQKISGLPKVWTQVSAGSNHTCAIAIGGRAYCWGQNSYGQLGNNSTTDSQAPVAVDVTGVLLGKTVKSISAGYYFSCAIASDSKLYCWGNGANGRLGRGSIASSSVPVAVSTSGALSGKIITKIDTGWMHACALASDQKVYCWGYGSNGQLGNNTSADSNIPVAVTLGALSVNELAVGSNHSCVVTTTSKVYCWGQNTDGQLGDNSTTVKLTPVSIYMGGNIPTNSTLRSITAGWGHSCAVVIESQKIYCWGDNTYYQVGTGVAFARYTTPIEVSTAGGFSPGKIVKTIVSGYYHSCVLDTLGVIYCWGDATYYQNGNSALLNKPSVISTAGTALAGKVIKDLHESSTYHTCLIATDDQIYCWGGGESGKLGNNLTANSYQFVLANQVP